MAGEVQPVLKHCSRLSVVLALPEIQVFSALGKSLVIFWVFAFSVHVALEITSNDKSVRVDPLTYSPKESHLLSTLGSSGLFCRSRSPNGFC